MAFQSVFHYKSFNKDDGSITLQGDAFIVPDVNGVLQLTQPLQTDGEDVINVGRALYPASVPIWNEATGKIASFKASFTFTVEPVIGYPQLGDGIIFFLAPPDTVTYIPDNSSGGYLGIVDPNSAINRFVAVEFDTHTDDWDPRPIEFGTHIGIDVNSVISLETAEWKLIDDAKVKASVEYISHTKILTATFEYLNDPGKLQKTVSQAVDLKQVLPTHVKIGLAATQSSEGRAYHKIHSWSFSIQP